MVQNNDNQRKTMIAGTFALCHKKPPKKACEIEPGSFFKCRSKYGANEANVVTF